MRRTSSQRSDNVILGSRSEALVSRTLSTRVREGLDSMVVTLVS